MYIQITECVSCLQEAGTDIGSGSFNIRRIQKLFKAGAAALPSAAAAPDDNAAWAAVQVPRPPFGVQYCNHLHLLCWTALSWMDGRPVSPGSQNIAPLIWGWVAIQVTTACVRHAIS